MMKKRLIRAAVILVLALGFSAVVAGLQIQLLDRSMQQSRRTEQPAGRLAGVTLGGPFTLVNQAGETVDETILKQKHNLIYFGFTFCPAICPTELQKIRVVMDRLGPLAERIQPVFITVDPERDTVDVMKNYVAMFHPRMMGLTGSPEAIADTLKHWRVYARKVQDPAMSDYTMDHSSYIYWTAPDGAVLGMFGIDQDADTITPVVKADLEKAD